MKQTGLGISVFMISERIIDVSSLLLKIRGVPMKQIQEWLVHKAIFQPKENQQTFISKFGLNANNRSKLISADAMLNGLGMDSK